MASHPRIPSIEQLLQRPALTRGVRDARPRCGHGGARAGRRRAPLPRSSGGDGRDHGARGDRAPGSRRARSRSRRRTRRRRSRRVINATGVILHTNLGRAPLAASAARARRAVAAGYSNLEYDLARGDSRPSARARRAPAVRAHRRRGRARRQQQRGRGAARAGGAGQPAAKSSSRAASWSRSAAASACRTSWRSRARRCAKSARPTARASPTTPRRSATARRSILRVHPSNFRIEGFTERPALGDLAALAAPLQRPARRRSRQRLARARRRPPGTRVVSRAVGATACGRRGSGGVQRRQAPRRAAGGHRRRARD